MVNRPRKEKGMTLTKYGFGRPSGGRFYLPLDDGYCNFYDRETGFNAILRQNDGTILKTRYRDVTNEENMLMDFRKIAKEQLGFDILDECDIELDDIELDEPEIEEPELEIDEEPISEPVEESISEPVDIDNDEEIILSEEFWKEKITDEEKIIEEPSEPEPEQEPEQEEDFEEFEPAIPYEEIEDMIDPVLIEHENEDEEREIFLAAPTDEDGNYEIIDMKDDEEDKFPRLDIDMENILEEMEDDLDSDEEEEEFKAPSPADTVNTRLTAASEAREFQPLNAYPEFPLGDGKIIKESKNWDYNTSEDVEVDLLNIVRSKDGKHIVKKTETTVYGVEGPEDLFKRRPRLPFKLPKAVPAPVIVVAAAVVALYFFSRVERTKIY